MFLLILALAVVLRLINLNQSLWLDEAISVVSVQTQTYHQLLTSFAITDVHPPLHYLVLRWWGTLFGYSEIAMRVPSVIFGLVAIIFTYKIGRKLFDKKVALVAAIFLAINPLVVYYSQEARMYALTLAAVAGSVYFFLTKKWGWFVLCFLMAIYSDYLPLLLLPIFLSVTPSKRPPVWVFLAIMALFLPWLPTFWHQFATNSSLAVTLPAWGQIVGGISLKTLPLTWIKFIIGRISLSNKWLYALVMIPISVVYFAVLARGRNRLLWLWLILPVLILLALSLKVPLFGYHRLLFVLPAFCLLLASGAQKKWLQFFIIAVNLVSLLIFNVNPQFQRENWREAVKYMESQGKLALLPSLAQSAPLDYYRRSLVIKDVHNAALDRQPTVFLIRYVRELFDPTDSLRSFLESSGYFKTEEKSFNGVLVWKYKNPSQNSGTLRSSALPAGLENIK